MRKKLAIAAICCRGLIGIAFFAKLAPLADDEQLLTLSLVTLWWFVPYIVLAIITRRAKDTFAVILTAIGLVAIDAVLYIDYLLEPSSFGGYEVPTFFIVPAELILIFMPVLYVIGHFTHKGINQCRSRFVRPNNRPAPDRPPGGR